MDSTEKLEFLYQNYLKNLKLLNVGKSLEKLRNQILVYGIPPDFVGEELVRVEGKAQKLPMDNFKDTLTLRGKIWKLFLGVYQVNAEEYLKLLEMGENKRYCNKVRMDVEQFKFFKSTSPRKYIRIYNAYLNKNDKNLYFSEYNYFTLYLFNIMPEADAFYCFQRFVGSVFPAFFRTENSAAEVGSKLVSDGVKLLEPQLWEHLKKCEFDLTNDSYNSLKCFSLNKFNQATSQRLLDLILVVGPQIILLNLIALVIAQKQKIMESDDEIECIHILNNSEENRIKQEVIFDIYNKLSKNEWLFDQIQHFGV